MDRVRLLVFNAVLGALDYRVPDGMAVEPGSVVVAPLGPRQILGIVWEPERLETSEVPDSKLRPIIEVLPAPPLREPLRRLIEWTAEYYCAPPSSVARMALASSAELKGGGTTTEYRLTGPKPDTNKDSPGRMTPQRAKAFELLQGEQATIRELAAIADPRRVPQAVASVLGVIELAGKPLVDALSAHVRERRLLIVLDNCEHLIDAAAELARQLLQASAELRILATSREPLRIAGETTYALPALAVPGEAASFDAAFSQPGRYMSWPLSTLRTFLDKRPELRVALQRLAGHDLAMKVEQLVPRGTRD